MTAAPYHGLEVVLDPYVPPHTVFMMSGRVVLCSRRSTRDRRRRPHGRPRNVGRRPAHRVSQYQPEWDKIRAAL